MLGSLNTRDVAAKKQWLHLYVWTSQLLRYLCSADRKENAEYFLVQKRFYEMTDCIGLIDWCVNVERDFILKYFELNIEGTTLEEWPNCGSHLLWKVWNMKWRCPGLLICLAYVSRCPGVPGCSSAWLARNVGKWKKEEEKKWKWKSEIWSDGVPGSSSAWLAQNVGMSRILRLTPRGEHLGGEGGRCKECFYATRSILVQSCLSGRFCKVWSLGCKLVHCHLSSILNNWNWVFFQKIPEGILLWNISLLHKYFLYFLYKARQLNEHMCVEHDKMWKKIPWQTWEKTWVDFDLTHPPGAALLVGPNWFSTFTTPSVFSTFTTPSVFPPNFEL